MFRKQHIIHASQLQRGDHCFVNDDKQYKHHFIVSRVFQDQNKITCVQFGKTTRNGKSIQRVTYHLSYEKTIYKVNYFHCYPRKVVYELAKALEEIQHYEQLETARFSKEYAEFCKTGNKFKLLHHRDGQVQLQQEEVSWLMISALILCIIIWVLFGFVVGLLVGIGCLVYAGSQYEDTKPEEEEAVCKSYPNIAINKLIFSSSSHTIKYVSDNGQEYTIYV